MIKKIKIAIIYGSNRTGRLCDPVAAWVQQQVALHTDFFAVDLIDPVEMELPNKLEDSRERLAYAARIENADAFIVVTPEYNHSYSAVLKHLIDLVHTQWTAKPVAFVSYGGTSGGLRAVEQLRLVFAELHAVGIRETVSFANVWEHINAGQLEASSQAIRAMHKLLSRLYWWADALHHSKSRVAYNTEVLTA